MSLKIAKNLFSQRRFSPLFILLQTGTFNDNALKNALIALITFGGIAFLSDLPSAIRVPVAAFIYTGPFLLVCAIAGQIADKIDRGIILRWVKRVEIIVMLIAGLGFYLVNIHILAFALGLMGAQSAFFSPTKNAVLPQWLSDRELITGNALLNGFVFVFVLVGQVLGTLLVLREGGPRIVGLILLGLAILGWLASEFCPKAPPPKPDLKLNFEPITATWAALSKAFDAPDVLRPMLGIAWFYGAGAIFVTTFPDYIASQMGFDANVLIFILMASTFSILIGSLITMMIGSKPVWGPEAVGLSALGITGVTLFTLAIYLLPSPTFTAAPGADILSGDAQGTLSAFLAHSQTPLFMTAIIGASIFNGMFVVPLQAMQQRRADPIIRARLMSAGAVLLNLFVNIVTFILIGLAAANISPKTPFLMLASISAIVAVYAVYRTLNPVNRTAFTET